MRARTLPSCEVFARELIASVTSCTRLSLAWLVSSEAEPSSPRYKCVDFKRQTPHAGHVLVTMDSQQLERWQQLFEQKRNDLFEEQCDCAVEVQSLEDLQRRLHQMAMEYCHGLFPNTLDRLEPSLNHLKSFAGAISSAAQYEPVAYLVWGVIQAVVEVC